MEIPLGVGTKRQPRLSATEAKHETMNLIRGRGTLVCSTRRSSHWKLGRWWSKSTIGFFWKMDVVLAAVDASIA